MCFYQTRPYPIAATGMFSNGTSFQLNYLDTCINNRPYTLCNAFLSAADAHLFCNSIGGYNVAHTTAIFGSPEDFRLPLRQRGLYNIACPSHQSVFSQHDCDYNTTSDGCVSEGGAALISCLSGESLVSD